MLFPEVDEAVWHSCMRCDVPLGPTISETPTVEIVALRWPKLPQLPDPLPHVTVNEAADTLTMEAGGEGGGGEGGGEGGGGEGGGEGGGDGCWRQKQMRFRFEPGVASQSNWLADLAALE